MARLATLVRRLRAAHPNVVFAHAGDMLSPSPMSTALRGAQMIATLNAVGLELATFGNHEFDFGVRVLGERRAESRSAGLSANVLERGDPRPLGVAPRDRMLERGGVRLGFFGLKTADAATASAGGRDAEFREPLAQGTAVAAELRRRGARLRVALTPQQLQADRAPAPAAGVDPILGGHAHEPRAPAEEKR